MTRRLRVVFLGNDTASLALRGAPRRWGRLESKALAVLVGVALCVGLGTSFEAEDPAWRRLAAMPRERRETLLARLDQFDALPTADQASIRALDAKIQTEPEINRAELFTTLRRYHTWFTNLTDAQKKAVLAAAPESRLALVAKLFAEQSGEQTRDTPFYLIADFGSASPYDLARQIRIWFHLDDHQRDVVLKTAEINRLKPLESYGKLVELPPIPTPTREKLDATYKTAVRSKLGPFLKKFDDAKNAEKKARVVDHYYFFQHPPEKVKPAKLLVFDNALPPWIRATIDRLPPDEAKRRLTILYRLVFPAPAEMPEPKPKAAAPSAPAKAPGKPAAKPSTKALSGPDKPF
jgi:hypothetical protein